MNLTAYLSDRPRGFKSEFAKKLGISNSYLRQVETGYQQRIVDGLNPLQRKYSVTFNLNHEQAVILDRFFTNHGGVKAFQFRAKERGLVKVVCPKWGTTKGKTHTKFSCEFEEVMTILCTWEYRGENCGYTDGSISATYVIGTGTDNDGQVIDFVPLVTEYKYLSSEQTNEIFMQPLKKEDIGKPFQDLMLGRIYTYMKEQNIIQA